MTQPSVNFRDFLLQHRATYVRTLPTRLAQLESLAGQLEDPGRRAAALPALELCVHSLAGSAGTFGFADLSVAARSLELLVEEARGGEGQEALLLAGVSGLREHLHGLVAAAGQPEHTP